MTSTIKHLSFVIAALTIMLVASFLIINNSSDSIRSVEFGLAELSPAGESGGYAMPASGASNPSGLRSTCSGDGRQVTLQWNSSHSTMGERESRVAYDRSVSLGTLLLGIPTAHAGGGGVDIPSGGGGGGGGSHSPHSVVYRVTVSTIGQWDTSATSQTVSVNPGQDYWWTLEACAGGACTNKAQSSFRCDAPPSLTLTADQYQVPYNTGTTLRWSSQHTNTCIASGAWAGTKSVSGSEPTGNLTKQTTYLLQCSGPRGSTAPAAATINITHGTGADITACKSVVHKNEEFCVDWNTGTSVPQNCVIKSGEITIEGPLQDQIDRFYRSITGETTFTLDCEEGGNTDSTTVKVLPEFQET